MNCDWLWILNCDWLWCLRNGAEVFAGVASQGAVGARPLPSLRLDLLVPGRHVQLWAGQRQGLQQAGGRAGQGLQQAGGRAGQGLQLPGGRGGQGLKQPRGGGGQGLQQSQCGGRERLQESGFHSGLLSFRKQG